MDNKYADVLVEIMAKSIDKTFTYKTIDNVEVGKRVKVPFGRRVLEGFVLK